MKTKKLDEFETRAELDRLQSSRTFGEEYAVIHEQRKRELLAELLGAYREGAADHTIVRIVARLAAIEDMNVSVRGKMNEVKKYEHRLEEIENERKDQEERQAFHQYHGG